MRPYFIIFFFAVVISSDQYEMAVWPEWSRCDSPPPSLSLLMYITHFIN